MHRMRVYEQMENTEQIHFMETQSLLEVSERKKLNFDSILIID